MGDLVNLRRARKQRVRRAKEAQAQANRIIHGQPKMAREAVKAQALRERARLDGHRLEKDEDEA